MTKDLVLSTQWRKYPQHSRRLREALEKCLGQQFVNRLPIVKPEKRFGGLCHTETGPVAFRSGIPADRIVAAWVASIFCSENWKLDSGGNNNNILFDDLKHSARLGKPHLCAEGLAVAFRLYGCRNALLALQIQERKINELQLSLTHVNLGLEPVLFCRVFLTGDKVLSGLACGATGSQQTLGRCGRWRPFRTGAKVFGEIRLDWCPKQYTLYTLQHFWG